VIFKTKAGKPPRLDLKAAKALVDLLIAASEKGLLKSAHDCSEGGLAVALAESCILEKGREIGAKVHVSSGSLSNEALLFGESQSRVVISVDPKNLKNTEKLIESFQFPYQVIGKVGGKRLEINELIKTPLEVLSNTWRSSIKRRIER